MLARPRRDAHNAVMPPSYLREPPPPRHRSLPVLPGIARMVADNPGPMTYHGTNCWLLDGPAGRVVIDPGPDDPAQTAAILAGGPVAMILLTHAHADHADGAPALARATAAPVVAHLGSRLAVDRRIGDGEAVGGLRALHTPGHASDHLCFVHPSGALFSGDQVMGWSSSVVGPPDGDMAAYLASLDRLAAGAHGPYLPGHGPVIDDPAPYLAALRAHRLAREAAILEALAQGPTEPGALLARLYPGLAENLRGPAARTLAAHLSKLADEGHIRLAGTAWSRARP